MHEAMKRDRRLPVPRFAENEQRTISRELDRGALRGIERDVDVGHPASSTLASAREKLSISRPMRDSGGGRWSASISSARSSRDAERVTLAPKEGALGEVVGTRDGGLVRQRRFGVATETPEQIGANRVK